MPFRHISNLPYGRTFFHHATNRYSDGRLVIDFVAEYLNLPYIPPYANKSADTTHGVNFAVGGCTVIPYSFFQKIGQKGNAVPESLFPTQLEWFKDHIKGSGCKDARSTPKQCKAVFDGALVWIGEIAANDYNYITGTNTTSKTLQELAIWYETKFIEKILKMGAKYIVVQGLPTTGCFPIAFVFGDLPTERDDIGCVAAKNKQSYDHNVVLQAKLHSLRKKFPSAVIVYGDDWHAYREVYKNPTKYGFTERFNACCGNRSAPHNVNLMNMCGAPETNSCKHPSRYMNWDGLHVTEGMSRVVSKLFLDGGFAEPPFPYLLKKAIESRV
ncbi:GDSL esterase/lipase [Tanacetum coccineum]